MRVSGREGGREEAISCVCKPTIPLGTSAAGSPCGYVDEEQDVSVTWLRGSRSSSSSLTQFC